MARKHSIAEAFTVLKSRQGWSPPEHCNTVTKFLAMTLDSMSRNSMSSSENYLLKAFGMILNENKLEDWDG